MNKKLLKRILLSTLGVITIASGVPFMVKGNVGSDCVTILYDALVKKVGLSIGKWTLIFGIIELIIVLILDKSKIGYTTLLYVLGAQYIIDFLVTLIPLQTSTIEGIIFVLIGILLMSLGCIFCLCSNLGLTIFDALCFSVSDHFKFKYVYVRYVIDGLHLIIGFILGGKFGVGTIIAISIFGIVIQCLKNFLYKPITKWLDK